MKYRLKPPEVEAFRYNGQLQSEDGHWYIPDWARKALKDGKLFYESMDDQEVLCVMAEDGYKRPVLEGDYIILNTGGYIYPMKPGLFESIYEYAGV